jgi:hypothetical protein
MKRKPSDDLKKLIDEALRQLTLHGVHRVADLAAAEIAWMQGYYGRIQQSIDDKDDQTFVNAPKELKFAKKELVALARLYQKILRTPGW